MRINGQSQTKMTTVFIRINGQAHSSQDLNGDEFFLRLAFKALNNFLEINRFNLTGPRQFQPEMDQETL